MSKNDVVQTVTVLLAIYGLVIIALVFWEWVT